ncbi:hypothetical protein [uncultured Stenotrophomonas sp.]|uniref:hypothetical protein n=1 Tax=uncultured Stenotrophomonas sp. TaxID=165438 RepID=UPI0025F5EA83|nr:hypothetical protein [uncultured Stenotrophomonas sp.]
MKSSFNQISTTEIVAITTFGFVVGALSAVWAVGKFGGGVNAADWVAAVAGLAAALGTWAIGVGANKYAQAMHGIAEDQRRAESEERARQRGKQIRGMKRWANLLVRPSERLGELVRGEIEGVVFNASGVDGNFDGARQLIASIPWNDSAWTLLGEAEVDAWQDAFEESRIFIRACDKYMQHHHDLDRHFDPTDRNDGFPAMRKIFANLAASGNELLLAIERVEKGDVPPPQ